jgi:hypothetical protein
MDKARIRNFAIGAAAAVVLVGGGAGVALASGGSPAHPAGHAPIPAGRCAHLAERLRANGRLAAARQVAAACTRLGIARILLQTIHGQFTVETKHGPKTIALERGTIESVGGSTITVMAKDGTTWTWDLVANTVVRQHGSKVGTGALADGQRVLVAGPVVSGANDARVIMIKAASSG